MTGPYAAVAATLTLLDSESRLDARPETSPIRLQVGRNTTITTSTGVSDPGVFQAGAADKRYPPFKGAGAVSTWRITLPGRDPSFDYSLVSDVILELSYTSDFDGSLRDALEERAGAALPGTVDDALAGGLPRIIALSREFPEEFFQLLHPAGQEGASVNLSIDPSRLLPHWLARRTLSVRRFHVALQSRHSSIDPADLQAVAQVSIDGVARSDWSASLEPDLSGLPSVSINREIDLGSEPSVIELGLTLPASIAVDEILLRMEINS